MQFTGIGSHGEAVWRCQCDCGQTSDVKGSNLTNGGTTSCGCKQAENASVIGKANLIQRSKLRTLPYGRAAAWQLFKSTATHANERKLTFLLTFEQFLEVTSRDCDYCGAAPSNEYGKSRRGNGSYVYSGLDRIDNTLGYLPGNVAPCCWRCNTAKSNMPLAEFRSWISRIYVRQVAPLAEQAS